MKIQLHVGTKADLSFNLRHFWPMKSFRRPRLQRKTDCQFKISDAVLFYRYLVRRQMIESGMLEWLIDHLKQFLCQNANNISTYGLEYSTALFMNLCLHRSGKLRCLPMAQKVLSTFLQLLSSTNKRKVCINPKDTIKYMLHFRIF